MTDINLLKNTRNTRNPTGTGWGFSLCTADEGESDSEPEDASTGSHSSSAPSLDAPISEEIRIARDLDLAARQDAAIFKSNPWTIAKLRAATRKPPPSTPSTGKSGLSSALLRTLTSTQPALARSSLDPHLQRRTQPQPTLCGEKLPRRNQKLSPPRTKRKLSSDANSRAMRPNTNHLPGVFPICLDSSATHNPGKRADAMLAQTRASPVDNFNAVTPRKQCEEIQPSSMEAHSKWSPFPPASENFLDVSRIHPHFVVLVSVSPVGFLKHTNSSLSPVKHTLHSPTHTGAATNRFSRLLDPLSLPQSSTGSSSYEPASPVSPRPPVLPANRASTKRKRSPSPLRPTGPLDVRTPSRLWTMRAPTKRIISPKTPVHRQRASAHDSRVFTSADEKWSTLSQKKLQTSTSKGPISMTQNPFRIPGLKLPTIGNRTPKKSWVLTTFQPPPPLKVPNTFKAAENLTEDDGRIPPSEIANNSSSQTVVENENADDEQVYLDRSNNNPPPSAFDLMYIV
jgi:hypothetical protein